MAQRNPWTQNFLFLKNNLKQMQQVENKWKCLYLITLSAVLEVKSENIKKVVRKHKRKINSRESDIKLTKWLLKRNISQPKN